MSDHAIEVSGISYAYDGVKAVDAVDFSIDRGEILGFLGPNGAGKSTTIKMVTGQLRPQSGSIRVLDMDMPARMAGIQARIGVCFEEKNLYTAMTAVENLAFFARLFGMKHLDPRPLLERVGLADRADDRVADYSKGMRQRLMMARTLINTPEVLFLDEPTDGLDPVSAQSIRRIIEEEAARGAAVLLTTHDMNEADKLSDRVAFINEGRILTIDTPENLKLEHGSRSIRIRTRDRDGVSEQVIPLDEAGAEDRVRTAMSATGLLTVHTEEATLEDIFIKFAGRGLE